MTTVKTPKINGVSFVASRDSISETHIQPVVNINANYAAIDSVGDIYLLGTIENAELKREPDKTASGTLQVSQTITRKLAVDGVTLSNINSAALDELESSEVDLFFIHESELQNFNMSSMTKRNLN